MKRRLLTAAAVTALALTCVNAGSAAVPNEKARAVRAGVNLFGCYRWSVLRQVNGPPHRWQCFWQTKADRADSLARFVVYRIDPDCVTVVRRYTRHYY